MILRSPAFASQGEIPSRHTCEGDDLSPPLAIEGVPAGAKSLAMIVQDPDAPDPKAPKMTYIHWVLFDVPPGTRQIAEGETPKGARAGLNDWKKAKYGGPCPPIGRHRYFFRLFALDCTLPDLDEPTAAELESAMKGHVIATAELMGTYAKRDAAARERDGAAHPGS